jgi:hypothetical protein
MGKSPGNTSNVKPWRPLETIVAYRKKKGVTYIQYNIPDEDHIEAYDVRDPRRYV